MTLSRALIVVGFVTTFFTPAYAQNAALFFDSQPGDYIGGGVRSTWVDQDPLAPTTFSHVRTINYLSNFIEFTVTPSGSAPWILTFGSKDSTPMVAGVYETARRGLPANQLSIWTQARGCNVVTGRFVIHEVSYGPNGRVHRFAADFEQHCEDAGPALFGAIRYFSTAPVTDLVPFGGAYPRYELGLTAGPHGRVRGPGLDCGGPATACSRSCGAPTSLPLVAIPDPGYIFAGWTGDCHISPSVTIHVNGPKQCAAVFEPSTPTSPRTLLRIDSYEGEYVGQGRIHVLAPVNSKWTAGLYENGNWLEVELVGVGPSLMTNWTVRLRAPVGEALQVGRRYGATGRGFLEGLPTISVYGNGRGCNHEFGHFMIRELGVGQNQSVEQLAVEFEQHCELESRPPLTGTLTFNSTVDMPRLLADERVVTIRAVRSPSGFSAVSAPQTVRLSKSGPGVITWTAAADRPWITLSPGAGAGSSAIAVGAVFDSTLPDEGVLSGTVTVTPAGASEASIAIAVRLEIVEEGASLVPFGAFDTPLDNSTGVTGAVPFGGWAMDDVGVKRVGICRAPVAPELAHVEARCGGAAQIHLGDAVFVEGARPDVQLLFPTAPGARRAGWGFMVLTNMLPNQGTGTYQFSAYAEDWEGRSVALGTRTISCANALGTKPFGTIDTPTQGEVVSGSSYVNFGWVLTHQPKIIPLDGGTITVLVDGAPLGNVTYNNFRPDIATFFPGLGNSDGAIGFKILDTTQLADGLHTISWTVRDSFGATEGIGSRYFTVSNGTSAMATAAATAALVSLNQAPLDARVVRGRRGWDLDAPWTTYRPGADGGIVVHGEELDRFELAMGGDEDEHHSGYLRLGQNTRSLPIGSNLDATTGVFTWAPGVGFVGNYDLVFLRARNGRVTARRDIRIVLHPRGRGATEPQIVIDTPRSQQDVAQPFLFGGWAADLGASVGTGITALHVWAYPLSGGPPAFLGSTVYGGLRPDVAAVHGRQFGESGFGLNVDGLAHGHYDLAVFAWSIEKGGFLPPRVVRVTVR